MKCPSTFSCPVEATLDLIGGKYKALILWHLIDNTLRFNEIGKLIPKATPKMLTDIDASIITDHMMMEATYLGLGSVWVCYFKPDILKAEFKIPDNLEPVNILVLGYADTSREKALSADRHAKMRNALSAMVSFEKL